MSEFQLQPMTASASKELTNQVSGMSFYEHPKRRHAEGGSTPAVMTSPAITIMFTIVAERSLVRWTRDMVIGHHTSLVSFINFSSFLSTNFSREKTPQSQAGWGMEIY